MIHLQNCKWNKLFFFLFTDKALAPYLQQIDLLEESVLKLEQTAYKLDNYSKQLGKVFLFLTTRGHPQNSEYPCWKEGVLVK